MDYLFEPREHNNFPALLSRKKARCMVGATVIVIGMTATLVQSATAPASAAANCDVQKAGDFAVQAHLQLVNGAAVNPGRYFTPGGAGSCISNVMLQSFDLSNLIPDIWGMVSSAIESAIVRTLTAAMTQVCNAANSAIQNTVGNLNNAVNTVNNGLSGNWSFLNFNTVNPAFTATLNGNGSYGVSGNGGNNAFGVTGPVTGTGTSTGTSGTSGSSGFTTGPAPSSSGGSSGFTTGPGPSKSVLGGSDPYNDTGMAKTYVYPPATNGGSGGASGIGGYVQNPAPTNSLQESSNRSASTESGFWGRIFGQ